MKITNITFLFVILFLDIITAQIPTGLAPLTPGNKWVYYTYIAGDYTNKEIYRYEVIDSIKLINEISFFAVLSGRNSDYSSYYGQTDDLFYVKYDTVMTDSLYKYFKANLNVKDTWAQKWEEIGSEFLYTNVVDTFSAKVFGRYTRIYVIDRSDSVIVSSREYWTKEFGMLNGLYEQAEDILVGCVIDGVLYGDTTITGIDKEKEIPHNFVLYQNYPNPFNPSTVISWQLVAGSNVRLEIYNLLGEKIKTLTDEYYNPGEYSITLNAEELPSGIYFYRLITADFIQTKKMVLVR